VCYDCSSDGGGQTLKGDGAYIGVKRWHVNKRSLSPIDAVAIGSGALGSDSPEPLPPMTPHLITCC